MRKRVYFFYILFFVFTYFILIWDFYSNKSLCGKNHDKDYTCNIPGTSFKFDMVYIPGGEFSMGSPKYELGHDNDESPVHRVKVNSFWMGKCEVTWNEFECYAFNYGLNYGEDKIEAVTKPSASYEPYDHGWGRGKRPAMGVSFHAAKKYCEWLSLKTGRYYRLPTEAEWEYACRAGSSTAYSFGDDPEFLKKYAWYEKNSERKTQEAGKKLPNVFGLYDMHGNVWEYCTDYYDEGYYMRFKDKEIADNPKGPDEGFEPVIRGGSWSDHAYELRSSNRMTVPMKWWERDPMMPRGIWWLVDGQYVGFRVVRPANDDESIQSR